MSPVLEILSGPPPVGDDFVIDFGQLVDDRYALVEYNIFTKETVRQKIYTALRRYNNEKNMSCKISTRSFRNGEDEYYFVIKRKP